MKKIFRCLFAITLSMVVLIGCLREKQDEVETEAQYTTEVKFNYDVAAVFEKVIPKEGVKMAPQSMIGTITVTDLANNSQEIFNWYVVLDEDAFTVTSNTTIALPPSTYDFNLVVLKGSHTYVGNTQGVPINDGENSVNLILKPIIGDILTDTNLTQTANLKFKYDVIELLNIVNPKICISVDSGLEQCFSINKTSGLSGSYLVLIPGNHHLDLRFLDGNTQIGKSIDEQENIVAGTNDILMNIVPLHGEIVFDLTLEGGDARFEFTLPSEIVEEAGDLLNLRSELTLTSSINGTHVIELTLTPDNGDYRAETTFTGFRYDTLSLQLKFFDTSKSPDEEIAIGLLTGVTLTNQSQNKTIDITLKRRSLIIENLLAVIGVNVYDGTNNPVSGAKIYANNVLVGITGNGTFGTAGYLKFYRISGSYTIKADNEVTNESGEVLITVAPLEIVNVEIILSQVEDTTPDQFVFIDQTNVTSNTIVTSNQIIVTGINAPTSISISGGGGRYSINGSAFLSSVGTINDNDTVTVRLASGGASNTITSTTLTIGGVSNTFDVATISFQVINIGLLNDSFEFTYAIDINNNGQIVGYGYLANNGPPRAFIYDHATQTMSDMGTLDGDEASMVWAINNNGTVVGFSRQLASGGPITPYRKYENGVMAPLPFEQSYDGSMGINDSGQIVGGSQALLYENGNTIYVNTLNGRGSKAYDINNNGQAVGFYDYSLNPDCAGGIHRAFMFESNTMVDLTTRPGFGTIATYLSYAHAINDNGQIVGHYTLDACSLILRAFVYDYENDSLISIDPFIGGNDRSQANDINNLGQVVGSGGRTAFLYENGEIIELACLKEGGTCSASAINELGWIVGHSEHSATLWIPN